MDSPWLMLVFTLADRLGEADPRKIASLPANILRYWQAWLLLTENAAGNVVPDTPENIPPPGADPAQQCADVMRILGQ